MSPSETEHSLGTLWARDARRGAAAGLVGCAGVALLELVLSIWRAQGSVRVPTLFRFAALDATLVLVAALFVVPAAALFFVVCRAVLAVLAPTSARTWKGLCAGTSGQDGPQALSRATPWLWAFALVAVAYLGASFGLTRLFLKRFKDPVLIAACLAGLQLVLALLLAVVSIFLAALVRRMGRALAPFMGAVNPFGRPLPALFALGILVTPAALVVLRKLPYVAQAVPWRQIASLVALLLFTQLGARHHARRDRLWPIEPRRRRRALAAFVLTSMILGPLTLWKIGADPESKYLAMSASPTLSHLVDLVRTANDFDRDGYGSLLAENDCAPFNPRIHPNARDLPDNGIDENCSGRDFSAKGLPSYKTGERMPLPDEYRKPWNILLLTVDTVRYDHTVTAGYLAKRGRNTTPNLDKLAQRSVWFRFANTPAPGTMAAIPAIQTSKFFHSGIALSGERRPHPPKVLPENDLLGEVLKRGGYRTGALTTHEYFNDWGLDQGYDSYDNSLGAKPNPMGSPAPELTDKAQAWIAKQGQNKWFLWCHYIDPHGRYVAHPGETQYGTEEEDLYDGELAFTDKHLGRLLDWLSRSPFAQRTVVILTSDHGDGFMEHGHINHGMHLHKELLHVPLVVYVPDIEPHQVDGPVSGLDIFPTIADLAGIDISDLSLEGESLVPQLFYGRDAKDRVVFAETNYTEPQRAAIANDYKLIYNLKANVYQLFDLESDPWEKKNLWGRDQKGGQRMKDLLDEWLDRVYYSRDAVTNQAQKVRSQVLLSTAPQPQHIVYATGGGGIQILGWDSTMEALQPGNEVQVTVYFKSLAQSPVSYRLEAELARTALPGKIAPPPLRQDKIPADGTFPTSRWRPGEYIKVVYSFKIPSTWTEGPVSLGVRLLDDKRQPAPLVGKDTQGTQARLGSLLFIAPQAPQKLPLLPKAPQPMGPLRDRIMPLIHSTQAPR